MQKKRGKSYKGVALDLVTSLGKKGIGAYLHCAAKSGSAYIRFDDQNMRSIRIGDHDGREEYRYKFNLRRDVKEARWIKDREVWRFYCPMHRIDLLIEAILKQHQFINNKKQTIMGVGNGASARTNYLNIKEGKLILRKGDITESFDYVEGVITSIAVHEGKFGKELHLGLTDGPEFYLLQMKFDSGYSRGFLMTMKNIDFSGTVKLQPNYKEEDGKKKSTMFVVQNGKALKWFWNKDNRGDLPDMEQLTVKGQKVWDNTKQMAYLESVLLSDISTQVGPVESTLPESMTEDDDLPF